MKCIDHGYFIAASTNNKALCEEVTVGYIKCCFVVFAPSLACSGICHLWSAFVHDYRPNLKAEPLQAAHFLLVEEGMETPPKDSLEMAG